MKITGEEASVLIDLTQSADCKQHGIPGEAELWPFRKGQDRPHRAVRPQTGQRFRGHGNVQEKGKHSRVGGSNVIIQGIAQNVRRNFKLNATVIVSTQKQKQTPQTISL
jgi:hypothetical protein